MFTGIIEATGVIKKITAKGSDLSLDIYSDSLGFSDVKLGDSIASNGVCLTVSRLSANTFSADVSTETLARTCFGQYQTGQRLNLEKALLATGRLGGHLVSGHIDAVVEVLSISKSGRAWQLWLSLPEKLTRYVAEKGSVTVDGISLTVNELGKDSFRLTIVPHTANETTLVQLSPGSQVHLEVDLIARYLERLLLPQQSEHSGLSLALLQQRGFL
ncbi:riboflavin synthase [Arsukibacterium sp.]|uniref:riboflavin synthase n=1 Tax=Arsukibacterium sp. TaxID=1977258 RepID=UPI002FDACBCB